MSSEQIFNNKSLKTPNTIDLGLNEVPNKSSGRVDINQLLSKVREKEKKQKKENFVFLSLIGSVVVITGIIASL
tara:strand:+ start:334 stop:555 length:222 start_codon:yes stop_codon:yes gene_type:complete